MKIFLTMLKALEQIHMENMLILWNRIRNFNVRKSNGSFRIFQSRNKARNGNESTWIDV